METKEALRWAVYYHLLALVPTVVGLGIALAAVWFGALGPLLEVAGGLRPQSLLSGAAIGQVAGAVSAPLTLGGLLAGYLVWRVGRTVVLFKFQGAAVERSLESPAGSVTVPESGATGAGDDAGGADAGEPPADGAEPSGADDAGEGAPAGPDGPGGAADSGSDGPTLVAGGNADDDGESGPVAPASPADDGGDEMGAPDEGVPSGESATGDGPGGPDGTAGGADGEVEEGESDGGKENPERPGDGGQG